MKTTQRGEKGTAKPLNEIIELLQAARIFTEQWGYEYDENKVEYVITLLKALDAERDTMKELRAIAEKKLKEEEPIDDVRDSLLLQAIKETTKERLTWFISEIDRLSAKPSSAVKERET